jgi:hypothetical protein
MNQQELFIKWNGKVNDFDGVYGGQCVDIIKQYFKDVLGILPIKGNALDYWERDIPGFTRIKKSAFAYPKPGDIIVWDIGLYGHIGICNWSRTFDLSVFEQNYPVGSPCHFGWHTYRGVVGWLRPTMLPPEAPRPGIHPVPVEKSSVRMVYLSDEDDIKDAMAYCDAMVRQFTGQKLGIEYIFNRIPRVEAKVNFDLSQDLASNIVEQYTYDPKIKWIVLGYHGFSSSPGYSTQTSFNKNLWFTMGHAPFPKEILLFELKHFLVKYYNQHRGSNPYIENYDNYKSADGGIAKVEEQIRALIPYLSVFNT